MCFYVIKKHRKEQIELVRKQLESNQEHLKNHLEQPRSHLEHQNLIPATKPTNPN